MPEIEATCIGKRLHVRDNRLRVGFRDTQDRVSWFGLDRHSRHYRTGAVYRLETSDDGKTWTFSPPHETFKGLHPDLAERLAWQAASDAAEAQDRRRKNNAKKARALNALDVLKPLHDLYRATDYIGRLALEVTVLNYLRRGEKA